MTSSEKPYSQACENNKDPILSVLRPLFVDVRSVLEIGSGTGQHAAFFSAELPHLHWQTSDLLENHAGIRAWLTDVPIANRLDPINLDVSQYDWGSHVYDAVFSANTLHIMAWPQVEQLLCGIQKALTENRGLFVVYGPFKYNGAFTSESNARFDTWLRERNPVSGIRDFEKVDRLAQDSGLTLVADYAMPANNRLLVWRAC